MKSATFIAFLLVISTFSLAQNKPLNTDSLEQLVARQKHDTTEVRVLRELGSHYSKQDPLLSFRYFQKALKLSEKLNSINHKIDLLNDIGSLYHQQGNYDSSFFFHRQALAEARTSNNTFQAADSYHLIALSFLRTLGFDSARQNLAKGLTIAKKENYYALQSDMYVVWGNTFLEEGKDEEALKQFIMSAKLQDSLIHDPVGQSRALLNIANIQYKLGDYNKAITYAREAQPLAEKGMFDQGLAYASQLLGRIYRKQKKSDEALAEYNKALTVYKRQGNNRSVSETLQNIGNTLFDKGNMTEAGKYYYESIEIARRISSQTLLTYGYASLGHMHFKLKQYDQAFTYTDSARLYAVKIEDPYSVLDAYELFALIKEEQRDYKSAFSYFKKAAILKDSLTSEENKAGIAELEIKYQNDKKEKEIELLKKDQELQKLELGKAQANRIIIILALISVIIISVLLVNRYRVLNRSRRMIEMERMRNSIARDLHDDIGSTLSSINIISQMALKEANGGSSHFQRIAQHSSSMMESMSDIVWSINPNHDSWEQVISKMKEFASEILDPLDVSYSFFGDDELHTLKLDAAMRKNLFLIFKEAVNNAAKYSSAKNITIIFKKESDSIHVEISDDGKGFDPDVQSTGNGLRNMRERAETIQAKLEIKSAVSLGTKIKISLPIT